MDVNGRARQVRVRDGVRARVRVRVRVRVRAGVSLWMSTEELGRLGFG